ncbi:MAG: hypothetical protein II797_04105 [Clostridia bacterium]|nr:hypothetical protein [Clostridia bacterium]
MIYALIALVLLFALWLYFIFPARKGKEVMSAFEGRIIAHRGMFSPEEGRPENTMISFRKAVENGYGIETDIHITRDNRLVLSHDDNLKRVFGVDFRIEDHDYEELTSFTVPGTSEHVPLLRDLLDLADGKVPLVLELKGSRSEIRMVSFFKEMMESYRGDYCIESFDPFLVQEVRRLMPSAPRGILADKYEGKTGRSLPGILSRFLLFNSLCRPHFISYGITGGRPLSLRLLSTLLGAFPVCWTIRTPEELKKASKHYSALICENLPLLFPEGQTSFW